MLSALLVRACSNLTVSCTDDITTFGTKYPPLRVVYLNMLVSVDRRIEDVQHKVKENRKTVELVLLYDDIKSTIFCTNFDNSF